MNSNPICIFDSGIGGLSVFSRLFKILPCENYIYFGDTLNAPYGNKSKEQLIELARDIFDFFALQNAKAVVMACNTTSAVVYDVLKSDYDFEIYPIVQNVSKYIADKNYDRVGVFATNATVNAHAYKNGIEKYNKNTKVFEIACGDWASIVENSLIDDINSLQNIRLLMRQMLEINVQKIVLGCTHYPYLLRILSKYAPEDMFMDPAEHFAIRIADDLKNKNLLNNSGSFETKFLVSANSKQFETASELFFKVNNAKQISLRKLSLTK